MIATINKKTAILELIEKMKSKMEARNLTPVNKEPKNYQNKVEKSWKSEQEQENQQNCLNG